MEGDEPIGPLQASSYKTPKKSILLPNLNALHQMAAKEGVATAQYWFINYDISDRLVIDAIMKIDKVKQISLYGRGSKIMIDYELKLPMITCLRLNQLQLSFVPIYVVKTLSLVSLNLSNNVITQLPVELAALVNLKELFLTENRMPNFPMVVLKLVNLQKLDINFNLIPSIPEEIGLLKKLNSFGINYNPDIKVLPKSMFTGLKNLKILALVGTKFYETPSNKPKMDELKRRGVKLV